MEAGGAGGGTAGEATAAGGGIAGEGTDGACFGELLVGGAGNSGGVGIEAFVGIVVIEGSWSLGMGRDCRPASA